ncbi:Phospho-2-dehydro-3-deoxyheptonate aldolase 2, chloroplastic [Zea mays]|uniref:Phospho-2-dehydro-3-deoxyheptonate aldolase n=1 Tax=Zea mays TaxID=4577 RepID=A0A317YB73_MAIZE|nr:Phospho-2-dehydro-3-deoxyheptonate aldolase 2, chloroplastic [Zea mays]
MGVVLMFGGQVLVVKVPTDTSNPPPNSGHQVGRMAGQFAKPRSEPFEEKDGVKLPSYRGDNVNGDDFTEKSRVPDPQRMIRAYAQSVATLNLLRAFATGGYAAMQRVTQWNLDFMDHHEQGDRVDEALGFMTAAGLTVDHPIMTTTDFWTSHECLLLPYEQALTREDSTSGLFYDCSTHMLWVSDKMNLSELVKLIKIMNPSNKPRRITIITRMGAENMRVKLPHLIRVVRNAGLIVTWITDPMHGNTIKAPCGLKTRPFDSILYVILEYLKSCHFYHHLHLYSECSLRYIMVIKVSDPTGEAWVSVFNEHAEKIIGCSADELDRIRKEISYLDMIKVHDVSHPLLKSLGVKNLPTVIGRTVNEIKKIPLLTASNFEEICGEKTPVYIIGVFGSNKAKGQLEAVLSEIPRPPCHWPSCSFKGCEKHTFCEVHVQSDPAGRLVITGDPEQPNNPWGITPFKKVVVNLPSRINPHQTSAVVTLHGQLFVRAPFGSS